MAGPTAPSPDTSPATVRHHVENLLTAYTRAVDDQDPDTVARLLAGAEVSFDGGPPVHGTGLSDAYRAAFAAGGRTRHVLCAGSVLPRSDSRAGTAWFPYQRWSLDTAPPAITALGRYQLSFDSLPGGVRVTGLRVVRDWQHR